MAKQRYEYYNTGDDTEHTAYDNYWLAQTFTPAIAHKIVSVKLLLWREGLPGTITVGIKDTTIGGHPTGGDLCSGTTDGNTLPDTQPGEWREILLGAGYDLAIGTKYAIVVTALGGDASKVLHWRYDGSDSTYAGGCLEYSGNSGGTWISFTSPNCDLMFEEWSGILGNPNVALFRRPY